MTREWKDMKGMRRMCLYKQTVSLSVGKARY